MAGQIEPELYGTGRTLEDLLTSSEGAAFQLWWEGEANLEARRLAKIKWSNRRYINSVEQTQSE